MASADILPAAHSPLPWEADRSSVTRSINNVCSPKDHNRTVALRGFSISGSEKASANTEFVFRACNAHYQMLEALKCALADIEHGGHQSIEIINAAIDKAEGR